MIVDKSVTLRIRSGSPKEITKALSDVNLPSEAELRSVFVWDTGEVDLTFKWSDRV